MTYDESLLNAIYDRTSGKCHLCGKKLAFTNYACVDARAAWEVDHSVPRVAAGTDHLNNLLPACIACNRSKGSTITRTARARNGRTRAPLSRARRKKARLENALGLGLIGAAIGGVLVGPTGAVLGGLIGASMGHDADPDFLG